MPLALPARSPRLGLRALRSVGFAAWVAVATLVPLELGVRWLIPQTLTYDAPELFAWDETIGWRRRPHARVHVNLGERDVEVCTDERGDRVSCHAARGSCSQHVLVLGDSFVEALAVPWEETAWHHLERATGACVHAAGVAAWNPAQSLQAARERLARDRIDLVMLELYVGNDFYPGAERIPPPSDVERQRIRLLPTGLGAAELWTWFYPLNQRLESRSHAYVALRNAVERLRRRGTEVSVYGVWHSVRRSGLPPEVVDRSLEPVRELARLAREREVPLLVTLVPVISQVLDPTGERLLRAFPELEGDLDMDRSSELIVPRLAALPGARSVDLLPPLRERAARRHWGQRDGHFSAEGHRLWFEILEPHVRDLLGATPAPGSLTTRPGSASRPRARGGAAGRPSAAARSRSGRASARTP
jgi:hypothetical protein